MSVSMTVGCSLAHGFPRPQKVEGMPWWAVVRGGKWSIDAFRSQCPGTPGASPLPHADLPLAYVAQRRRRSFLPCISQGTKIWFLRKLLVVTVEFVIGSAGKEGPFLRVGSPGVWESDNFGG